LVTQQAIVVEKLRQENERLKAELQVERSNKLAYKAQAERLEKTVAELKQLPTGKISQIPVE